MRIVIKDNNYKKYCERTSPSYSGYHTISIEASNFNKDPLDSSNMIDGCSIKADFSNAFYSLSELEQIRNAFDKIISQIWT